MITRNGRTPLHCPRPGSTNRLIHYRNDLVRDREPNVFDDRVFDLLKLWVRDSKLLNDRVEYLNNLTDDDGRKFYRSNKYWSKMKDGILKFTEPNHPSFQWNRNYQRALRDMKKEFSEAHLSPLIYQCDEDIIKTLPKQDTSAGFTGIMSGKKRKGDNLDGVMDSHLVAVDIALANRSLNFPIVFGYRTQASGEFDDITSAFTNWCKLSTRVIHVEDLEQIICENKFAKPFQAYYSTKSVYMGGKSDQEIHEHVQKDRLHYDQFISLDYSRYDQTISDWLIWDAFDIVKCAFDCFNVVDQALWDAVTHDFIHKTFLVPEGELTVHKGVPSGSMFTQIIDSIVNELMLRTFMYSIGCTKYDMLIMGDDNLIYYSFGKNGLMSECASYLMHNFGIVVNTQKSSEGRSSKVPEFLSRFWTSFGPWRSPAILTSRLLFPERFRDYKREDFDPEDVLYSYCLAYPKGMEELIYKDKFVQQYFEKRGNYPFTDTRFLTGFLRFRAEYGQNEFYA